MTDTADGAPRILGSLSSAEGAGVVRIEDAVPAAPDEVWSALTDPARLADWLGDVSGDLRAGGSYRAFFRVSEWDGVGRIDTCEPPRRLVVAAHENDSPREGVTEITLTADGERTRVVVEQAGLPLEQVAAYGAGLQVHVEDLIAHVTGDPRRHTVDRWGELYPGYQRLAVDPA